MKKLKLALCQDCLRIQHLEKKIIIDGVCECGGEWCDCESCHNTAQKLIDGERSGAVLGLALQGTIDWTKETGIIEEKLLNEKS